MNPEGLSGYPEDSEIDMNGEKARKEKMAKEKHQKPQRKWVISLVDSPILLSD